MAQLLVFVSVARDGAAYAQTIGVPVSRVLTVRPATTGEIASFSTALTGIEVEYIYGNSRRIQTFLSSTATNTVFTAANA